MCKRYENRTKFQNDVKSVCHIYLHPTVRYAENKQDMSLTKLLDATVVFRCLALGPSRINLVDVSAPKKNI